MKPYRYAIVSVLAVTACCATLPLTAYAQETDRRSRQIEEVTVTARRIEESLQDTPVSVSAFSKDDLEQIGVTEAKDIADHTPNLAMRTQSSSFDNYNVSIRGVSEGETSLAIDPTVGVYIDGIYLARQTSLSFDIVDLERIEVLRGPQGTLFGRNTIGGAINIITAKPSGELALAVEGGYGNRDIHRAKVTVDTPPIGGFAAKFSVLDTANKNYGLRSVYTGDEIGVTSARGYRVALRWEPGERHALDYSYDRYKRDSNPETNQLTHVRPIYADPDGQFYGGPFYEEAAANDSPRRLSQLPIANSDSDAATSRIEMHTLTWEWAISERLVVKSISSYRDWERTTFSTDFGTFPVRNNGDVIDARDLGSGSVSFVPVGTLVPLFAARMQPQGQEQITQEFQFIGSLFDERLHYNAGLYYFEEEALEDNPQTFVLPTSLIVNFAGTGSGFPQELADAISALTAGPGTGSATLLSRPFFYTNDNRSYAVYGQATWNVMTDFDITVGARYTVDERETTLRNIFGSDTEPSTFSNDDEWSELTPSITFDYRWSPQISTYFTAATGYRSGGFNVRATTESAFRKPFDPETLLSYEFGAKTDLLDRSLRLNIAVFRLEYEDKQISQFEAGTGGAASKVENAGRSITNGLEIDALYQPLPGLRLIGGYGYVDVNYKEFISGPVDPVTGFPSGGGNVDIADEVATDLFAPEHTASAAIEYTFAPWRLGELTLRLDASYTDSYNFHPQYTLFNTSEAHTLVNARVTLADIPAGGDGRLRLALWGKNITGREYRDFGIDFGILGFAMNNYAPLPRWGLDLSYDFNR